MCQGYQKVYWYRVQLIDGMDTRWDDNTPSCISLEWNSLVLMSTLLTLIYRPTWTFFFFLNPNWRYTNLLTLKLFNQWYILEKLLRHKHFAITLKRIDRLIGSYLLNPLNRSEENFNFCGVKRIQCLISEVQISIVINIRVNLCSCTFLNKLFFIGWKFQI